MHITFRLIKYRYTLTLKLRYCGATSSTLKPRIGEDWIRGNDLRDGRLWRLPWVLADIIAYECNLGRWGNPQRCRCA